MFVVSTSRRDTESLKPSVTCDTTFALKIEGNYERHCKQRETKQDRKVNQKLPSCQKG